MDPALINELAILKHCHLVGLALPFAEEARAGFELHGGAPARYACSAAWISCLPECFATYALQPEFGSTAKSTVHSFLQGIGDCQSQQLRAHALWRFMPLLIHPLSSEILQRQLLQGLQFFFQAFQGRSPETRRW